MHSIFLVESEDSKPTSVHSVRLNKKGFHEQWLQQKIADNPSVLQLDLIDQDRRGSVLLGREIEGVDLLLLAPNGKFTLVETKLVANPEAHRKVLAQVIDYLHALRQLNYRELEKKVQHWHLQNGKKQKSLYQLVCRQSDEGGDEEEFENSVNNSLRQADVLLLIVGDEIKPHVVDLASYIHSTPGLHYSLAFLEVHCHPINKQADYPLVMIPRVVKRVGVETRAVVKVYYEEKRPEVEVSAVTDHTAGSSSRTNRAEFLARIPSELAQVFASYLDEWAQRGYTIYWGTVGFSLRIAFAGKLCTMFDAYPVSVGILQPKWIDEFGMPQEPYAAFREHLRDVPAFSESMAVNQRGVSMKKVSVTSLELLLAEVTQLCENVLQAD